MQVFLALLKGIVMLSINLLLGTVLVQTALKMMFRMSMSESSAAYQASMFFLAYSYIILPICLLVALLLWFCEEAIIHGIKKLYHALQFLWF